MREDMLGSGAPAPVQDHSTLRTVNTAAGRACGPVRMRAASLNMHDIGTLRGRLPIDRYAMILGCDGAGVLADGTEVVIPPCVNDPGWIGPETLDPGRSVLSGRFPGTFAESVAVPARNVVAKPPSLSFAEAACTGTAWLTAYRMLFVHSGLRPGQHALVRGRP